MVLTLSPRLMTVPSMSLMSAFRAPAYQPLPQPARAGGPLRLERLAQLGGSDPSLLEHGQAERNAMAMHLRRAEAGVHLPAERGFDLGAGAGGRAAPSALKDRRTPAAPQLQPSRGAARVGAGLKKPWAGEERSRFGSRRRHGVSADPRCASFHRHHPKRGRGRGRVL